MNTILYAWIDFIGSSFLSGPDGEQRKPTHIRSLAMAAVEGPGVLPFVRGIDLSKNDLHVSFMN